MTREQAEAAPNWQATYYNPKTGRYTCVMRTLTPGSYYWHSPDYQGLFAWGATRSFDHVGLTFAERHGYAVLTAGTPPPQLEPEYDEVRGYWREEWFLTGVVA
jgi:hypothetical protein